MLEPTPDTPEPAPEGASRDGHRRSSRGAWTIVAIFAVGFAVLAGLMLIPRNKPPAAPAGVPWGIPPAPVSVVTCDLSGRQVGADVLAAEVRSLARAAGEGDHPPDFLVLSHIGSDEAMALARVMGMQASYRPQHHQRARGASGFVGLCILSPHPLYEGAPLRIDRKQSAGVSAVAVAGGRKFRVACVYAGDPQAGGMGRVMAQRQAEGGPPSLLVLAGGAGPLPEEFRDVGPQNQASQLRLLATRRWRAIDARVAGGMAWHLVGGAEASSTSATRPAE